MRDTSKYNSAIIHQTHLVALPQFLFAPFICLYQLMATMTSLFVLNNKSFCTEDLDSAEAHSEAIRANHSSLILQTIKIT
jgi:hypothetical protein